MENKLKRFSKIITVILFVTTITYGFFNHGIAIDADNGSIFERVLGFYLMFCCFYGVFGINELIIIDIYKIWKKVQKRI